MNKPNEQTPTIGPARSGDVTLPGKAPRQDPKETAPMDTGKSYSPNSGRDVKPPLHAAKGNDEVMSTPPSKQT